jgi:hypothetical protein
VKKLIAFIAIALAATPALAADNRPVTQDQFKQSLQILKRVVDRFDRLERKMEAAAGSAAAAKPSEESVDLSSLGASGGGGGGESGKAHGGGGGGDNGIGFKVYFDHALVRRPGVTEFSWDSYHSFLLAEIVPTPDVQFAFEVSTAPKYFELDVQVTKKMQLRLGKIWIPFDDMAPHNIFGGRVNVSRLAPGAAFLPDLWTDLGAGVKFNLIDTRKFGLEAHLYTVNGFGAGGTDGFTGQSGEVYPKFSDLPISTDNNKDKAFGGRIHMLMFRKFGLGASIYRGRWSSESRTARYATMLGVDSQLRLGRTEFRAGLATGAVQLDSRDFNRGGAYLELGQKLGRLQTWKVLARGGTIQLDDRVISSSDQRLVGGTLLWQPNMIQYSLEASKDLQVYSRKRSYSYMAFRVVIAM